MATLTIARYASRKGMRREGYNNLKTHVLATAKILFFEQKNNVQKGVWYNTSELFKNHRQKDDDIEFLIIKELKERGVIFSDDDKMFRF